MTGQEQALRVLSQALQLEKDGQAFYLKAAEQMKDARCQRTFRLLADDERVHLEIVQRQLHAIEGEGNYVLLPDMTVERIDLGERLFPPSDEEMEAKLKRAYDELGALQVALENEIKSYDLYRQAAGETEDAAGQQMYNWLASAERNHFNMLMANYDAIVPETSWL